MVRGSSDASLQIGIECYLEKDYSCAIDRLKEKSAGSFYLGVSYLGLKQYEEALEPLLALQDEYPEYPMVNWYLGLTYLRLDRTDDAIINLEKLSSIGNPYGSKAEKLIKKIGKIEAASKGVQ